MSTYTEEQTLADCAVIQSRQLTDELFLLRLKPPKPIPALPGQFAMLKATEVSYHPLLLRPMSILSAGDELTFLIRRCGQGTELLTSLRPDQAVTVIGPVGQGWPEPKKESLIFVAGGVGLAPLLFAARHLSADQGQKPVFLYGAKNSSDLVLLDEIEKVAELRIATDDGSRGHHGLVTELLDSAIKETEHTEIWTCGPEKMMDTVVSIAFKHNVDCTVSVESRMACGRGLCLGCAREDASGVPKYVCKDGPVFDAKVLYPIG